ncbi:MAG: hypothetical protein Q7U04_13775 [Bacteriovorax sp.]|nr:hypothetical protein [Bacteriovorax sp.]
MKLILGFFIILLISQNTFACGQYGVTAKVMMKNGFAGLVIYPGTKSEINLQLEAGESLKLSAYINRTIKTSVMIEKEMDHTLGSVASLGPIEVVAPDPLANDKGTRFELLKNIDCKK